MKGVSLEVAPGETLGIVGESGCGKTTLARMLVGLIPPTDGRIEINGTDRRGDSTRRFGRDIQYVFQDPTSSLNPRMTIRDILSVPLRHLHGMDGPARAARRPPERPRHRPHCHHGGSPHPSPEQPKPTEP